MGPETTELQERAVHLIRLLSDNGCDVLSCQDFYPTLDCTLEL